MKKILSLSLLLMTCLLYAQSPSKNFIKTKVYKVAYHGTETLASRDTLVSITYFNGFGQPIQSIAVGAGGNGQDIVTPITYDNGRKTKSYLPYADPQQTTSSLSYRDNDALVNNLKSYYVSKFPSELSATNPNPYTEISTEASPFERVEKTAAPGEAWKMGNKTVKSDLLLNEPSDAVLRFKVNFFTENAAERTDTTSLACVGYYGPNTLTKKIIRNENWNGDYNNHDNTTEEYLDSEGRLVLKRAFNQNQRHDTYYVYDKFNNLSYVIPPLASDQIVSQSLVVNPNGVSLPWGRMVLVDDELAEEYNKALKEYNSPNVLAADLLDKYGATGGFSVVPDAQGNLTLSINIQTNNAMPYRTGAILDLKEIGQFPDKEIGKITVDKHDYVFYVSSNQLFVKGDGKVKVPSISVSLTSGPKLSYSKNYNWTQIMNISDEQVEKYEPLLKDIPNEEQNITLVENEFGAVGGITLNIDDQDNVEFFLNFNSIKGLSLKEGSIFPLDISRKITDRSLGELKTADYSYRFFIKDNFFIIEGKGKLNNINFSANKPFTRYFINQESLDGLCYIYHYDSRNRQIEKHIPGKGWTQTVYDRLNRPVLVQDENLRAKTSLNWLYTKYDVFNRVVYSGEYTDARNRRDIQAVLDSASLPLNEDRIASNSGIGITENTVLYTNNVFPTISSISSVNYYDDYTFVVGKGNTMPTSNSYGETITANAKSMATCSKVLTLGTNNWESTVFYYEDRGLLVSTQSSNQYLSTSDLTEQDINFAGQILAAKRKHTKGSTTLIVEDLYTYNQVGQVLKQTEKINGGTEQLILYNKYNELGTLVEKKVGGTPAATYDAVTGHLQKVKYAYTIRGWLKSINNPDTSISSTDDNDLFAFKVNYNTTDLSGSEALYNGNISETLWRSKTDDKKRGYSYHYDALNRLTDANYIGNYTMAQYPGQVENYTEGAIRYDKQGNIIHLERYGLKVNTIDKIDDLSYTYMPFSNKLVSVSDAASIAGFNNGSTENLQDYNYDLNGNLISDANKRITRITYNYLDLPVSVQKSSSIYINYTYNAVGGKIEKKYNDGVNVTTTQYANGFVYQNGVLQYFPHAEGYVQKNSNGSFTYIYQYKDHLGNVRLSYFKNGSGSLEVVEEENYYAFGMKHRGYNNVTSSNANNVAQKIEFNGKEFQDDLSLNWYDYGARNYDPTVGRWFSIDPLSSKYFSFSPYVYTMDNPVYFVDIDGMQTEDPIVMNLSMPELVISGTTTPRNSGGTYIPFVSDFFSGSGDLDAMLGNAFFGKNLYKSYDRVFGSAAGRNFYKNLHKYDKREAQIYSTILLSVVGPQLVVESLIAELGTVALAGETAAVLEGAQEGITVVVEAEEAAVVAETAPKMISQFSSSTIDDAVAYAMKNKVTHVFAKAEHNLDPLVTELGGHENTFRAVLNGLNGKLPSSGIFNNISVNVGSYNVLVRGSVVNGVPKIGTMFIP